MIIALLSTILTSVLEKTKHVVPRRVSMKLESFAQGFERTLLRGLAMQS
jgi:hypothetical protein